MELNLAKYIVEACECNAIVLGFEGGEVPEIYENYSGRGMFGEATTGIIVSSLRPLMAAIACHPLKNGDATSQEEMGEMLAKLKSLRTDNMGRDQIIVY